MVHLVKFFISIFKHTYNTAACVGTGSFLLITVLILSVFLTFVQLHLWAMSEVKTLETFGLYNLGKEVPQIRCMIITGDIVYNGKRVTIFVAVLSVHVYLLSYFGFRFGFLTFNTDTTYVSGFLRSFNEHISHLKSLRQLQYIK